MTKEDVLKKIAHLDLKEQTKYLAEKYRQSEGNDDVGSAVVYCEMLARDYDVFGYRFELTGLYNVTGQYHKTIDFVFSWLEDKEKSKILQLNPGPILDLADAFVKIDKIELAIDGFNVVIGVAEGLLKTEYKDMALLSIGRAKSGLGKIYYQQKNYQAAYQAFRYVVEEVVLYSDAVYYLAHMLYRGVGVEKDVKAAIDLFEKLVDVKIENAPHFYNPSDQCVMLANYELGAICSTEPNYLNKEEAIKRLHRAKNLGYEISEEEIKFLIDNIVDDQSNSSDNPGEKSGGCYIATCVYGSYDCPSVWSLRRFRDRILSRSLCGRLFIRIYYAISPAIVRCFGQYAWFHKLWKAPLDYMVSWLNKNGVEGTPYSD